MLNINYLKEKNITLDLATEAHALLRGDKNQEISGVQEDIIEKENMTLTEISILDQGGAEKMGRPIGHYYTIDVPTLLDNPDAFDPLVQEISAILKKVLPKAGTTLLCGLGNPHITADALGPKVIHQTMATRHFFMYMADQVEQGFTSVAAITPDVMGNTGLESAEIIKGVVKEIGASAIVVIDALAAANITRLATSFQISDTGITPGGGLGNQRLALNEETMGVPVIAMGVPTVVHFSAIIGDVLNEIQEKSAETSKDLTDSILNKLAKNDINFAVTPKDIDCVVDGLSDVLTTGIHLALHDAIDLSNYSDYINLNGALL